MNLTTRVLDRSRSPRVLGNAAGSIHSVRHVVVVTGASSGIGYATALEFARSPKFKVYATMRSPEKWDRPAAEDGTSLDNLIVRPMDVTSAESVKAAIARIAEDENGKIDIVVNNAGYGMVAPLEGATIQEAQNLFDVNVWGPVRLLQEVLPYMRKRRGGHVINVSSTSAMRGTPCAEYYSGSKFALEGIMDSMRYSLAAYNISVSQINPGPVVSNFTEVWGNAEKGGLGTRTIPGDVEDGNYLSRFAKKMVDLLRQRMVSGEAQDCKSCAKVIVNMAHRKMESSSLVELPFNSGTNEASQAVIASVKVDPAAWTGTYAQMLSLIPPLEEPTSANAANDAPTTLN